MHLITCNPALANCKRQRATEMHVNTWIINGFQQDEFQTAVRAHSTKNVGDINEILSYDITEFIGFKRIANVTKAKGGKKRAPAPIKSYSAASSDKKLHHDCGNCGSPDHE